MGHIIATRARVAELRAKAEPVGPQHAAWDEIFELEELLRAHDALARLRRAWADRRRAEGELARLARYSRLSPGMKDDRDRWSALASEAEATIKHVLGG